jgi:hypothetical protein
MSAALVNQTDVGGKDVLDPNVLPAYFREGKESFFHRCSLHSVLTQPSLGQQLVRVGKDVSIVMHDRRRYSIRASATALNALQETQRRNMIYCLRLCLLQ